MKTGIRLPTKLLPFIWHFARPYGVSLIVLMLVPSFLIMEAVVIPYALKEIIDTVTSFDGDRSTIVSVLAPYLWIAFFAWFSMIIVFRSQEWLEAWFLPNIEADIRMAMFDYTHGHSHNYFASNFAGSLSNKVGDMVSALRTLFVLVRWEIVTTVSITIAAMIALGTVDMSFALVVLLWVIIMQILIIPFAIHANRIASANAEHKSTLAGKLVDSFTNITNVRLFARSRYERKYLQVYQDEERASNRGLLVYTAKFRILIEVITGFLFFAIFTLLIQGWQEGTVTGGDFVFVFYTSFNVIIYVWQVSMQLPEIFKEVGIARQALSIITPDHEIKDRKDAQDLKVSAGEIRFDQVGFNYIDEKTVFRNKTVTIKAGEKVGLVGFSGSGKSTFVNLILRLYEVNDGAILIDGQNVAEVTQDSLHSAIAMIPQDTSLFHRTLMDNIRYGRPDASDEEVIAASKKAHCHEFIKEVPEGYDALVGERGVKLSGGQRQRIAVARAILKDAPILILDEATSALDSQTEKHIQASLQDLMEDRTTIVIAHRLSTLSHLDRILVFHEGEIIEEGTHDTLVAHGGHYAHLWSMQAGGFIPESA